MIRRVVIPETPTTKALVAAVCTYETVAILTGRFPTITTLSHRHPIVGAAIVLALAIHFLPTTPAPPATQHHKEK